MQKVTMIDKQIEEIAKILAKSDDCGDCTNCMHNAWCPDKNDAELIYNAGYRKASDVVRELIEDIATLLEANWKDIQHGSYWLTNGRCMPLRELLKTVEKKYTESED